MFEHNLRTLSALEGNGFDAFGGFGGDDASVAGGEGGGGGGGVGGRGGGGGDVQLGEVGDADDPWEVAGPAAGGLSPELARVKELVETICALDHFAQVRARVRLEG
jgi:hypothetical protein